MSEVLLVNKIEELVTITIYLGGEATLDEICKQYGRNHHMVMYNQHKAVVLNTLSSNPSKVMFLQKSNKWKVVSDESTNNENNSSSNRFNNCPFDDLYFESTPVAVIVKTVLKYIIDQGLLSLDDVENLQSKEYSLKNLGCAYPVLITDESKTIDNRGRKRYYKETISVFGTSFFLCKEWYDSDKKHLIPWFKSRLEPKQEEKFYFMPTVVTNWNYFEKIRTKGEKEYFVATKDMKIGDYIVVYISKKGNEKVAGIYALAKIISNPSVLTNNSNDYCYQKLAVYCEYIVASRTCLIDIEKTKEIAKQFQNAHIIEKVHYGFLKKVFNI